jgi:hypothetical protein
MPSPQVESVSELYIKPLSTYRPLLGVTPGFLRPKPDAHRMYAQDQVVIHTVRM